MNKQYAHALFQLAKEDNTLNECKESFDVFVAILKENPDFELVLSSPKIKTEEKKDLIKRTFKDCSSDFIYFLYVVLDNRRMDKVLGIYEEFLHLYNEENKVKVVKVLSDKTLTILEEEKLLQSLKIKYPTYEVSIVNVIDSNVIGGYHIFVNGVSMDLSIKRKIKNLEEFVLTKPGKEV